MRKLLVICGPTATGKTSLGIRMAKRFNGEIVSADSRQVYKGMDIGTGKDLANFKFHPPAGGSNFKSISNDKYQMGYYVAGGVKIWMLDVVNPDQKFSVADYVGLARKVIEDIWRKGKLPIIVGGTGFYIKALVDGIETLGIEPDWELRKILSGKDIKILSEELQKLDPRKWQRMNESDRKNPRRLIRAIEVGQNIEQRTKSIEKMKADVLFVGLTAPKEILYQRIDKRVEERVKMGVEGEIKKLLEKGFNWENSVLGTTPGYMEWQSYFERKVTSEEVIARWKFDEHAYARRQMTWFRKALRPPRADQGVWFDIMEQNWHHKLEKLVSSWYNKP